MKNQLVSICIPNYNNEEYIGDAIQSALNQTYKNIEVIVVDNDSSDKSWEVISAFKDSRLVCYKNDRNIGMYPNFMLAASKGKGEFIKFICADDWIDQYYVEKSLNHFINDNIGMATSSQIKSRNGIKVGYRNIPTNRSHVAEPSEVFNYFLNNMNPIGNPTRVIIRMDVFRKMNGFKDTIKYCNDYDLWMRISKVYNVAFIKEYLSFERKHNTQNTIYYNSSGEDIKYAIKTWTDNYVDLNNNEKHRILSKAFFPFYYNSFVYFKKTGEISRLDNVKFHFFNFTPANNFKLMLLTKARILYLFERIKYIIIMLLK